MTTITQHLRITGRVQGVGYRCHMAQQARALGLIGWVRNRHDGSVEAQASGPVHAVQALVRWAHHGPEQASGGCSGGQHARRARPWSGVRTAGNSLSLLFL